MQKYNRKTKIFFLCASIIMALACGITGTIAWFHAQRQVEVLASGFEVSLPPHQEADFYYMNCNYNRILSNYSGYELSLLNDEEKTSFTKIDEKSTSSPTSTKYLWPNHQLTYAVVFTPFRTGSFSFEISSWTSEESKDKLIAENKGIRLSWAIKMYVGLYDYDDNFSSATKFLSLKSTTDESLSNGFKSSYKDESDLLNQTLLSFNADDLNQKKVLYFTILFSNEKSTYFSKKENYYEQDDDSLEESNCYENLTFEVNKFILKAPEE